MVGMHRPAVPVGLTTRLENVCQLPITVKPMRSATQAANGSCRVGHGSRPQTGTVDNNAKVRVSGARNQEVYTI